MTETTNTITTKTPKTEGRRVQTLSDTKNGLSLHACDDGVVNIWVELAATRPDGTTDTIKLTRAQAKALHNEELSHAAANLRQDEELARAARRPATANDLSVMVGALSKSTKPVEKKPAPLTAAQAKERRTGRLSAAEHALKGKQHNLDWSERWVKEIAQIEADLKVVEEQGITVNTDGIQERLDTLKGYATQIPKFKKDLADAQVEVVAAQDWDGYGNE